MKKRTILALLLTLLLSSCVSIPEILEIDSTAIEKPTLDLPPVDVIKSRTVEYIVVTPENIDSVWQALENSKTDLVLFSLTDNGYKNLSLNLADVIRLLKQQRAIILAYTLYYENRK